MYIQLYALYIETCITSNMYIQLYALYIEERQGVRIPDAPADSETQRLASGGRGRPGRPGGPISDTPIVTV